MSKRLRQRARRTLRALIATVCLCLLAAWVAGEWIIPAYIGRRLQAALAEVWAGPVRIREVRFRYFGPIDLIGVRVEDEQSRQWIEADVVRVRLRNWPGLSPALHELEVDRLAVQLHLDGAKSWLIREPADTPEVRGPIDLDHIRVHSLLVSVGRGRQRVDLAEMRVAVNRKADRYVLLVETLSSGRNRLTLNGTVAPGSGEFEAAAYLARSMVSQEFELLCEVLGRPLPLVDAKCHISGGLQAKGILWDPESIRVSGEGHIDDGALSRPDGPGIEHLSVSVGLRDGRLSAEALSFHAFGGRARGSGLAEWKDGALTYRADVEIHRVDLAALNEVLGFDWMQQGVANGEFAIEGTPDEPLYVKSRGSIRADVGVGRVRTVGGPFGLDIHLTRGERGRWASRGQVTLDGWDVAAKERLISDLKASLDIRGREIEMAAFTARLADGTLTASGQGSLPYDWPREPMEFTTSLSCDGVRMDSLTEALGPSMEFPACRGSVRAEVRGTAGRSLLLRAAGQASMATQEDRPKRLTGTCELTVSGLGGQASPQITGLLTDWVWTEDDRKLLALRQATIESFGDNVRVRDMIVDTPGGQVSAQAQLRHLPGEGLAYTGEFSCQDFDAAGLFAQESRRDVDTRLNLAGTFAGHGAKTLTAQAEGKVQVRWPAEAIEAGAVALATFSAGDFFGPNPAEHLSLNVDVRDGVVFRKQRDVISGLTAKARLTPGGGGAFHLAGLAAGGQVEADIRPVTSGRRWGYVGEAKIQDIDLARLPDDLSPPSWMQSMRISGTLALEGVEFETLSVRGEGAAVGKIGAENDWDAAGNYDMVITMTASTPSETSLITGKARLAEWTLSNYRGTVVEDLRFSVLALGRSVDVGGIRGTVLGGQGYGVLRLDMPQDKPMAFRGKVAVDGLDLTTVAQAMGHGGKDVAGKADLAYRFDAQSFALQTIRGRGALQVRDSQMTGVPLLESLLGVLGAQPAAAADADLDLAFENVGEIVTLTDGRLATPVVAVSPIPGGTVNLATRELDLHVVAALLNDIDELVNVPLLELFVPFARRLSQLHVTGTWDSRETVRVRKEPLGDLGAATVEFLKGVVKTGGDLTEIVTQPMQDLIP